MKTKLLLLLLMIVLVSSFSYGALTDNIIAYYPFDADCNDSSVNNNDCIMSGTSLNTTVSKLGGASHFYNKASYDNYTYATNTSWAYNLWFYSQDGGQTGTSAVRQFHSGYSDEYAGGSSQYPSSKYAIIDHNLDSWTTGTSTVPNRTWTMLTWVRISSNVTLYINGTQEASYSSVNHQAVTKYAIGNGGAGRLFWGNIDEFGVWNRSLSVAEIQTLFNSGAGLNPYASSAADYINISTPQPATSSFFSTSTININASVNSTYNFNYSLYINGTISGTYQIGGAGIDQAISFSNSYADGSYYYYLYAVQANDTSQNETTASYTFYVDSTVPTQTNNLTNQIVRFQNNNTYKFNFADNLMLWGFNISINGINVTTTSNIQVSAYQFNGTIYGKNYTPGKQNVTTWFADAHTAATITSFNVVPTKQAISFDSVQIKTDTPLSGWTYEKKIDRYTFCAKPSTETKLLTIEIPKGCYYQNREDLYKGWFVCPETKKWMDFEGKNSVLVNGNMISVAQDEATKEFCFNSIGSLNEVYYNTSFYTFNDSISVLDNVTEQATEYFNLTINHGGQGNLNISNVVFTWNGTSYATSQTTNASTYTLFTTSVVTPYLNVDVNVSYQFNYTINGTNYYTPLTLSHIHHVVLDNCTDYFTPAVTFSFFNVSGGSNVVTNATMTGHVATNIYGSFNLTFNSNTTARICLFPNETIAESSQYSFIVPGCGTRNYYLSTDFSNSNQNTNLYCDSATTQVTFTVYNQYKVLLPDVYIYIQKYDVGTATATTTEIIKTDSNGQAVGNIIKNTQLYKFVLVYLGDIVLETSETYILLDTYSFTLSGGNTYFNNYDHIFSDTSCSLTYTNASTTYSYTFLDTSGNVTQGCLEIYRISNKGETLVNSSCTTGTSGSVNLIIPPPLGTNTYEGRGVVYIDSDRFVCSNPVSVTFDLGFKDYGTETLFLSFLMLVFLITVGLWNPAVAVALMCGGIFLLNIIGWFHMSKVWLIGFIILGGIVMYKMRQS